MTQDNLINDMRVELAATQIISTQVTALMLRLIEGIQSGEAKKVIDLIDQTVAQEVANATKRRNFSADLAERVDDEVSRQLSLLRDHMGRVTGNHES